MRELKFRVWDKTGKKMHFFGFDNVEQIEESKKLMVVLGLSHNMKRKYKNRETPPVMQFTGKQDQHGTDIYEGDKIEFDRKEWGGDDNIHIVSWNEQSAEWCFGGGCAFDMEWRTVIGNIYE